MQELKIKTNKLIALTIKKILKMKLKVNGVAVRK